MRNFGFVILYHGKAFSSRKHSGVDHRTFQKHFGHLTADFDQLSGSERQLVATTFIQWMLVAAVGYSGGYLNASFVAEDGTKEVQRAALNRWLGLLGPAINKAGASSHHPTLDPFIVTDALAALDAGEQDELFKASPKIGKQANAFTLTKHRYRIQYLHTKLKKTGLSAQKTNKIVERAANTRVDTIRKWKDPVKKMLKGDTLKSIRADLRLLIRDDCGNISREAIISTLNVVGTQYNLDRRKIK